MTVEFKVGDKATHATYGDVELVFGPVDFATMVGWLVKRSSGVHALASSDALSPVATFKVGDVVEYAYGPVRGKLIAGPFTSERHGEPIWVVEKPNGKHFTPTQNALRKVEPDPIRIGDRVRILSATYAESSIGRVGEVLEVGRSKEFGGVVHPYYVRFSGNGAGAIFASAVEKVVDDAADTFVHDGVTYELGAEYEDKDGDVWKFACVDGVIRGNWGGCRERVDEHGALFDSAVENYGPFTRI
ncbi:phiSA1p31-related protein [Streptomyces varsoviensis]|uniref:phiSA1p31-related protein n=1 Tax=Streptomyces varsoviensis TaxID=67373 RepID=UPI0033C262A1